MLHDPIGQGSHAAFLAFLNARLVGIGMTDNADRRDGQAHAELNRAGLDILLVAAILQKGVAKNAGIPILSDKCAVYKIGVVIHFFCNCCPVAPTGFQDAIEIRLTDVRFGQALEKHAVMILDQITDFPLDRYGRNLTQSIRALARIVFTVRIPIRIGIDNLENQKPGCTIEIHTHLALSPLL